MAKNFWLGNVELVILFVDGQHIVREIQDYGDSGERKTVFSGHYEQCLEYCREQYENYLEGTIC